MDCNVPTDIVFSLRGFAARGGKAGPHRDGFGIGFYDGFACRVFLDPTASSTSQVAEFLKSHSIKTKIAIAHIRRSTSTKVSLANTHPFQRELWGRAWTFAHNGSLKGFKKLALGRYRPIGTTDSEHVFCWMLAKIEKKFGRYPSSPKKLWEEVGRLSAECGKLGTFNLLMSDGRFLYCHCSTNLVYIQRKAPFSWARLIDDEMAIDFSKVTTPNDKVIVIATRPLTDNELWTRIEPGQLVVMTEGDVVHVGRAA
jgi:glutamine amidotransferase